MGALRWARLASPPLIDERKHRPGTTNSIRAAVAAGIRTQSSRLGMSRPSFWTLSITSVITERAAVVG